MKKLDPKELAGLMNMAMADHPDFRGNQSQMIAFFNETCGVKLDNIWPTMKNAFEEVGKVNGRPVYSFKKAEDNPKKVQPIYYELVEKAMQNRRDYVNGLNRQKGQSAMEGAKQNTKPSAANCVIPEKPKLNEEDCVKFLKDLGYKIYKPIVEYQEL